MVDTELKPARQASNLITKSSKSLIAEKFPTLNSAAQFRAARKLLREVGVQAVLADLKDDGFVDTAGQLTTGTKPFNVFARIASGAMTQPGMVGENAALGRAGERFVVAKNLPENDEHWGDGTDKWLGKASMGKHHRFLTTKDLSWWWFNVLVYGLRDLEQLKKAIRVVEEMKVAALAYAKAQPDWSDKIGLYFHAYGHASVNSVHLHIIDLSVTGPTFGYCKYKNVPLDDVLQVLKEELEAAAEEEIISTGATAIKAAPTFRGSVPTSTSAQASLKNLLLILGFFFAVLVGVFIKYEYK